MPIIAPPELPTQASPPNILKVAYKWDQRISAQFGGKPIPIGNAFTSYNMPWVDLNDGVSLFAQGLDLPDGHTLQMSRLTYRGRAITLATDNEPVICGIPFVFEETVQTLAAARAQLITAGQQYLSFDNGVTGIPCDCQSWGKTKLVRNGIDTLAWQGQMDFLCSEPFFRDIYGITVGPNNTPASSGTGTVTSIDLTYAGSFWGEPYYIFAMPSVAGAPPVPFTLYNTTSAEALTFTLPANGLSYVVDTSLSQVYQQNNTVNQIQHGGSFPFLYPPPGLVNNLQVTAICSTPCTPTLSIQYQNRWTT